MKLKKAFLTNKDLESLGIRSASHGRNLQAKRIDPIPFYKINGPRGGTRYAVADIKRYLAKNKIENIKL